MPDHVDWHRGKFDRGSYDLQSEPLLHEWTHACRHHGHEISTRNDGWYFELLAYVHHRVELQIMQFSQGLRQLRGLPRNLLRVKCHGNTGGQL